MSEPVDLAIVGAGFAGLACAQAAAARGLECVVLEAQDAPGARCRTTGILVQEVADAWDVPRVLTRRIPGVRLHAPGGKTLDLARPGYGFFATDTPGLLRWLSNEAWRAGAKVRFGTPFEGARRVDGRWILEGAGLSARFLVGADGACSTVGRTLGLGRVHAHLVGLEVHLAGASGLDGERLHCFFDSELAPGYLGWVVPGVDHVQVGLAFRPPRRARLGPLVERARRVLDLEGGEIAGRRAGIIPCGGPVRPFARDGAMLLGDAAGMVSPLTAGGIHPALDLGRLAGRLVASHLLEGGPDPARALARARPTYRFKSALRLALDRAPPNALIDAAFGTEAFRRLAELVYFHHRGLLTAEGWRALLLPARAGS